MGPWGNQGSGGRLRQLYHGGIRISRRCSGEAGAETGAPEGADSKRHNTRRWLGGGDGRKPLDASYERGEEELTHECMRVEGSLGGGC